MSLPALFESLRQLIANPTSNVAAASLALAVAVVFVLVIAVIIMIFIVRPRGSSPEAPTASETAGADPDEHAFVSALRRRRAAIIALLGIIAIAAMYMSSGTNSYCASTCHSMGDASESWRTSAHTSTRCVSCHETSIADAAMTRARHVVASVTRSDTLVNRKRVSSLRCLGCHEAILKGTTTSDRGIIVEHAHIVTAGMECLECHSAVGHGPSSAASGVMSLCLRCHDGERALNACFVCHQGDPSMAANRTGEFGTVTLPPPRCDGCHAAP